MKIRKCEYKPVIGAGRLFSDFRISRLLHLPVYIDSQLDIHQSAGRHILFGVHVPVVEYIDDLPADVQTVAEKPFG